MKRIDIVKKGKKWVGENDGKSIAESKRKTDIVKKIAQIAKNDKEAVTVKIHKLDNKIQEERTYPKSADPIKSRG